MADSRRVGRVRRVYPIRSPHRCHSARLLLFAWIPSTLDILHTPTVVSDVISYCPRSGGLLLIAVFERMYSCCAYTYTPALSGLMVPAQDNVFPRFMGALG